MTWLSTIHMGFAWVNCSKKPIAHDGGRWFDRGGPLAGLGTRRCESQLGSVRRKLWRSNPTPVGGEVVAPGKQIEHTPSASTVRPAGESMCTFLHAPLGHYCCVPLEPDELGTSQRGRHTSNQCPVRVFLADLFIEEITEIWEMGKWGNAVDKTEICIKTRKDFIRF